MKRGSDIRSRVQQLTERLRPTFSRRQRAVEACLMVIDLIQDVQRHRGVSGAILDGQTTFTEDREAIEAKLVRMLQAVRERYAYEQPLFRSPAWTTLLDRWEALRRHWRELDFATNLLAHNDIVRQLDDVLQEVARDERRQLGACQTEVLATWPALIEHLGMLRALGLHRIGRSAASPEPGIDATLREQLHLANAALAGITEEVAELSVVVATQHALRRVARLADGDINDLSAQVYFEEMTSIIDEWYRRLVVCLQAEPDSDWEVVRQTVVTRPDSPGHA